jgi:hypothetical protein
LQRHHQADDKAGNADQKQRGDSKSVRLYNYFIDLKGSLKKLSKKFHHHAGQARHDDEEVLN